MWFSIGIYLAIVVVMMLNESSLLYFPPRREAADWERVTAPVEEAEFTSADGTRLHGWYLDHDDAQAHVLLCHGNAEDVADQEYWLRLYHDRFHVGVLAWDYRGYGKSEGEADEQGILADGRAAQAWLANRAGIEPREVVIVGRSLGGGVAVDLAASVGARGLVLERTFTSAPDVAAHHYPWLPVRLLMRTQYNSREKIGRYHGPLLMTHGTDDEVVPYAIGRELFDLAPSENKVFIEEPRGGHNSPFTETYLQALAKFFRELPPPAEQEAK
ncbi:MAG: alpha/beta hydrolase [Pirellulaceae bacterium]